MFMVSFGSLGKLAVAKREVKIMKAVEIKVA